MRTAAALLAVIALTSAVPALGAPRTAPPFDLELFNGQTFHLAAARGTAVVLLFWAPW